MKAKVSFKKIQMVAKFFGIYPELRASTEFTQQQFEEILPLLNDLEFLVFYNGYEQEMHERQRRVRNSFKAVQAEKKKDIRSILKRQYFKHLPIDLIDEEAQIMHALESGNGDLYGF